MKKLSKQDKEQLHHVNEAMGTGLAFIYIREYFEKAGKLQEFNKAPTPAELQEQKDCIKTTFNIFSRNREYADARNADLFLSIARRVANDDAALAKLLPNRFISADADILEKCELKSFAALVRKKTEPKP